MQIANKVLMIRPARFYSNPETASDNSFQQLSSKDVTALAQQEFDNLVTLLRKAGVAVSIIQDNMEMETPDSIFPNNRISFHSKGVVVVYPMKANNRRKERELVTLPILEKTKAFKVKKLIDYSIYEKQQLFLEGTGSMIFDKKKKMIYAANSQRTNKKLVEKISIELGYNNFVFDAAIKSDNGKKAIYHTNVMLAIAEKFIIIADEVINPKQRKVVLQQLASSGRQIISITIEQMKQFCGNVIQLEGKQGNKIIAMSKSAKNGFTKQQLESIKQYNEIIVADIAVIEKASGGSVRCMLAEIF